MNRDGAVDVTGDSDVAGKTTWNGGWGAIFLPNLGDKQRRSETRTPDGRWLSNARLQACNDAEGNVVRAPEYLAPLRTVPVGDVSDAATGSLRLVGSGMSKVRLFFVAAPLQDQAYGAAAGRRPQHDLRCCDADHSKFRGEDCRFGAFRGPKGDRLAHQLPEDRP